MQWQEIIEKYKIMSLEHNNNVIDKDFMIGAMASEIERLYEKIKFIDNMLEKGK